MSATRAAVLLFLLVLTAVELAGTGATIWHTGAHPPSLQYDYGYGSIVVLGWLVYFGVRV